MSKVPNPGSDKAIELGCTCPVLDNAHGQGMPMRRADKADPWEHPSFWISSDCPIHLFPEDSVEGDTLAITQSPMPEREPDEEDGG